VTPGVRARSSFCGRSRFRLSQLSELRHGTRSPMGGCERLSIYLSESEIVFLIEAPEAEFLCARSSTILSAPPRSARGCRSSTGRSTARTRSTTGRPAKSPSRLNRTKCATTLHPTLRDVRDTHTQHMEERAMIERILYTAEATTEGGRAATST
jgi:hypothetical protein